MNATTKKIATLSVGAGAMFVSGAAFVPGTAEAHCSADHPNCGPVFTQLMDYGCAYADYCHFQPCCDQANGLFANCNPGHCQGFGIQLDCWWAQPAWSFNLC